MVRHFWYKAIMLTCVSAISLLVYFAIFADGASDNYYLRFTNPTQSSLILGTSRAAQGIVPDAFNNSDLDFDGPIYNFSFTLANTPYGPIYREAIDRKLSDDTANGLFILEVNPFSISVVEEGESPQTFREVGNFIDTLHFFNMKPNLEYLFSAYNEAYYTLALKSLFDRKSYLHDDGWLEVTVPMGAAAVSKRKDSKIEEYRKNIVATYSLSPSRVKALEQTIDDLLNSGDVFLVRLPTDCLLFDLESDYMPDFDQQMQSLAQAHDIAYVNLAPECDTVQTTDGNHLWKESGRSVSERLLHEIEQASTE